MTIFCWFFFWPFFLWPAFVQSRPRPMGEALQRAIERTKQFQATDRDKRTRPLLTQSAIKARQNQVARVQRLDVDALNRLLKTIDKTWVMPRAGVYEPVGSNFQYKKTCASIYRARSNACDQLGFGVMCFNFCYEQGEALEFSCEDASDSQFCQTHSNYDVFLSKHRKDAYRVKAYIHQQLTRCFMTAVCNGAMLNVSLMRGPKNMADNPLLHLRALRNNRPRSGLPKKKTRAMNISAEMDSIFPEKEWKRRRSSLSDRRPLESEEEEGGEQQEEEFGTGGRPKGYVPFWQRLLVRKKEAKTTTAAPRPSRPSEPPEFTVEEDTEEERRWLERRFGRKLRVTRIPANEARQRATTRRPKPDLEEIDDGIGERQMSMAEGAPSVLEPIGFWSKFQPGKWFQSVHYITNTG